MSNPKTCPPCNHNCDQGDTCPARFEPCNDACAAGACCPPDSACESRHQAPEAEPRFVYIPQWSDDLGNVVFASVLAAVVCIACFAAIAFTPGVIL